MKRIATRQMIYNSETITCNIFKDYIKDKNKLNASFLDATFKYIIAMYNFPKKVPFVNELFRYPEIRSLIQSKKSYLIDYNENGTNVRIYNSYNDQIQEIQLEKNQIDTLKSLYQSMIHWGGELNEKGDYIIDLLSPSPGPHYNINLLLGNRIGFSHPLQSTPKSVVDRLGKGSFRSHADTQVLATRWDMLPEENGFPANRQFYIVENGNIIFYSANPLNENLLEGKCIHSTNYTRIVYKTKCGLDIERTIFILPQEETLPLATEVQQIKIKNTTNNKRNLKIVIIGMFGTAALHALSQDIIYTNVIMQSQIIQDDEGNIKAIGWDYYPEEFREDHRFHSSILHKGNNNIYPTEFCFNYFDFVGSACLNNPYYINKLNNKMQRKGPGFFAIGIDFRIEDYEEILIDNLTGISSKILNKEYDDNNTYMNEISALISKFEDKNACAKALIKILDFQDRYKNFVQLKTDDKNFNNYFNINLPFQVLYQTFLSRSFAQTQKAYREIGFREIQDLIASIYNFVSMNKGDLAKTLLKTWANNIYEFGYANHNFYWVGKQPGDYSDDALWFLQALNQYIKMTNDYSILDEETNIAGTNSQKKRKIYETIKAIINYSSEISVGKHHIPLLDRADWNDCLQIDENYINGLTKEKLYYEQIEKSGNSNQPFISDYSESVMNGFLLKIALDIAYKLADKRNDLEQAIKWKNKIQEIEEMIQKFAWKEDFFARVLINKYSDQKYTYIGAKGDGLSADSNIDGSYYLNSFSWSIIANIANEKQIEIMLDSVEKYLKTPYGVKIISPTALEKLSSSAATSHYFPGDRENGGIFKHACMFFVSALFKASKEVENDKLAKKMTNMAYWMIDLTVPYKTINHPYLLGGNPRLCTQYINSETGENIGPLLSGTATWLYLSLINALGIDFKENNLIIDPILREEEKNIFYTINTGKTLYSIVIEKPIGFYRFKNSNCKIFFDDKDVKKNEFPLLEDHLEHHIKIIFN
ncbi:MAG: glycosyl transferase [Candidatus Lokiarchaeota archaeon]|nr:glycosyl transferase [Candidatus Lokiarchaeota archaeon]